jgi:hypothetical protein
LVILPLAIDLFHFLQFAPNHPHEEFGHGFAVLLFQFYWNLVEVLEGFQEQLHLHAFGAAQQDAVVVEDHEHHVDGVYALSFKILLSQHSADAAVSFQILWIPQTRQNCLIFHVDLFLSLEDDNRFLAALLELPFVLGHFAPELGDQTSDFVILGELLDGDGLVLQHFGDEWPHFHTLEHFTLAV